ncbi:MAG: M67 family metallopeptidase [Cyclobacteriaceae bacterium]
MTLKISEEAARVMQRDAETAYPNECCGFFYGQEVGDRFVQEAVPVQNNQEGDQRRRFEISPLDYMKAERYATEKGIDLLGVYHSHPDHPARPSEHDLKQAVPYFSYIIYSIQQGKMTRVTSWRLKEEEKAFEEEEIG